VGCEVDFEITAYVEVCCAQKWWVSEVELRVSGKAGIGGRPNFVAGRYVIHRQSLALDDSRVVGKVAHLGDF
jgi:hypothetical protein